MAQMIPVDFNPFQQQGQPDQSMSHWQGMQGMPGGTLPSAHLPQQVPQVATQGTPPTGVMPTNTGAPSGVMPMNAGASQVPVPPSNYVGRLSLPQISAIMAQDRARDPLRRAGMPDQDGQNQLVNLVAPG